MQTNETKNKPSWEEDIPIVEEQDHKVEVDAIGTIAPDDAYEVRTRHSFATHPASKGAVVLGVALLCTSTLGLFFKAMTGGFASNTAKVTPAPTPSVNQQNTITEADTLKAKLLLTDQNKEITEFKRKKQVQQAPSDPNHSTLEPAPVQVASVPAAPRPVYSSQPNYPPRPVYSSQPSYPPQVSVRSVTPIPPRIKISTPSQLTKRPTTSPPTVTPRIQPSRPEPQDPMQQWLAAANVGNYGSTSPQSNSRNYPAASSTTYTSRAQTTGGLSADPLLTKSQAQPRPELVSYSSPTNNIFVGTRANGKLETPIAWSGKLQNPNQNFLIQLTEPLLTANKSVAIPKGAYLVVRINDAADTGLLQMSATSALVTENGRTIEKPIPTGALLVLGKGGNLLKAQSQKRSNTGADLGMAVLSGVSNVTGLINQPSSQSTFSSGGGFQTTTANRDPNYLAGFSQGATQAIVGEMQARNQQARQSIQSEPKVFVLNQGAAVQVFVNQSFAL